MSIAFITHPDCLLHNAGPGHPEQAERLRSISLALIKANLMSKLLQIEAPLATLKQLLRVHDKDYIQTLFQYEELATEQQFLSLDADTVMNPHTLVAALRAAGSVVKAVDLVLTNQAKAAFCSVRPPGHHAEHARAMGFCFFSNVAVGIAHALKHHHLKRIALIDFDAHRGNGTEDIFQNNKNVFICSIFEESLYPYQDNPVPTKNGIAIPLATGTSGKELRAELTQHALEKIKDFKPELIFFSAGFDAHKEDTISHLYWTEADYLWITRHIKQIADHSCQGRMISVLEGGYALEALANSVLAHIEALE